VKTVLKTQNSLLLKSRLRELGAEVVGIADMSLYDREVLGFGEDIRPRFPFAISFGLLVPKGVLSTLTDGPTLFYLHHYRQVNYRLDTIAYEYAKEIEQMGYAALPFAASQMVDWQNQKGHISHKHVGVLAGIGWVGRNNLLVHRDFGGARAEKGLRTEERRGRREDGGGGRKTEVGGWRIHVRT